MNERQLRKVLREHEGNEFAKGAWFFQGLFLSVLIGVSRESWWAFGIAVLAFVILTVVRPLRMFTALGMSLLWGGVGWEAGRGRDLGASVVLGILFLVVALAINVGAVLALKEEDEMTESSGR